MNRDRWTRVAQLYDSALEHPPSERATFLARACEGDAELQRDIESLFAQDEQNGLLDRPVLEGAAALLGEGEDLPPGTQLGPYRLEERIGSGGMGDVYRAVDTRLDRIVAIKTLPHELSIDPQFRERFEREAKAVAGLSHPHICTLHDVGRDRGVDFLVLEYLEGETLAVRLENGVLPREEALRHAAEIVSALATAHRAGIVHRDLKPANVFLTTQGVKLLDFGLAMTTAAKAPKQLTARGMILGTFHYMAPEQLEGRPADPRTDIYAFGAVLHEMLTGSRPFQSQPLAPPLLDRLVRRCLARNPDERWQSAADLAAELRWIAAGRTRSSRSPLVIAGIGLMVGAMLAAGIAWIIVGRSPAPPPRETRFEITPPDAQPLSLGLLRSIAISPDGTLVVYRAGNGNQSQLVLRPMNELAGRVLDDTTGANHPFFSPDGRWIGFNRTGGLEKIPVTGGASMLLCPLGSPERGATWAQDDRIIFASADQSTGLLSVPAAGGTPTVLTLPEAATGELDHWSPAMLPDGRSVLFTIVKPDRRNNQVAVLDLQTGERKILIDGEQAEYVESGHLVYSAGGALRAVRFDPARRQVLGSPIPVVDEVSITSLGVAQFAVSRGGTLIYVPGGAATPPAPSRSLIWVDRKGREQPIGVPPRAYAAPRLSPDGTRIAVQIRDRTETVWTWDVRRTTLTQLSADAGSQMLPVWTPDSRWIIFGSERAGAPNLYRQRADGSGAVERLTTTPRPQFPNSVSSDGTRLIIGQLSPGSQADVAVLVNGHHTQMLIQTASQEFSADLSPDGRWLAYQSNESGQHEIYVRPFPNVDDGRWLISNGGGTRPAWARDGRELFYLDRHDRLAAVTIEAKIAFAIGKPATILNRSYFTGGASYGRPYDVAADGRFLMIKDDQRAGEAPGHARLVVVEHWLENLNRQ